MTIQPNPRDFERSLLPPNATAYMKAIEMGMRIPEEMWQAARFVGDAKTLLHDDVLAFLIWEYGLEPVMQWVKDPRRVLADGRAWQRIRGTPTSIEMALKWVDFEPLWIEETGTGTWWDLFQMSFAEAITDPARLNQIFALTRLSKAAHTDIIRVYNNCWDIRVWEVDQMRLDGGGYLDDWSGVWLKPEWPKISFCRTNLSRLTIPSQSTFLTGDAREFVGRLTVQRGFIVDHHRLDTDELIDPLFNLAQADEQDRESLAGTSYDGPYGDEPWHDLPYGYGVTAFNGWDPRVSGYGDRPYGDRPYGVPSFQAWEATSEDTEEVASLLSQARSWSTDERQRNSAASFGGGYPFQGWPSSPYPDIAFRAAGSVERERNGRLSVIDNGGYAFQGWVDLPYGQPSFQALSEVEREDGATPGAPLVTPTSRALMQRERTGSATLSAFTARRAADALSATGLAYGGLNSRAGSTHETAASTNVASGFAVRQAGLLETAAQVAVPQVVTASAMARERSGALDLSLGGYALAGWLDQPYGSPAFSALTEAEGDSEAVALLSAFSARGFGQKTIPVGLGIQGASSASVAAVAVAGISVAGTTQVAEAPEDTIALSIAAASSLRIAPALAANIALVGSASAAVGGTLIALLAATGTSSTRLAPASVTALGIAGSGSVGMGIQPSSALGVASIGSASVAALAAAALAVSGTANLGLAPGLTPVIAFSGTALLQIAALATTGTSLSGSGSMALTSLLTTQIGLGAQASVSIAAVINNGYPTGPYPTGPYPG